ncbi:MAG TPA: DUF924 family protein [Sphingomicrobium sp.]|nr:DUF924 family protein [Sphingomicrobium sp.]
MPGIKGDPAEAARAVLAFWFGEVGKERWWAKAAALDAAIAARFGALRDAVVASRARGWRDDPDTLLAAIILCDQFSRNIHRGSRKAFEADALARELTMLGLEQGWDKAMILEQRQFLLMPLQHSEKLADQERALAEFAALGDNEQARFAQLHYDQIARFGRFPGRNAALGRRTSEAEQEVIEEGAF